MNVNQPGFAVFSNWLNDKPDVEDELILPPNLNTDRAKSSFKEEAKNSKIATLATNTTKDNSKTQIACAERQQSLILEISVIQEV